METKKMIEKVKEIEMPKEMKDRIIKNCYYETEEKIMNKKTTRNFFKKPLAVVATLVLCLGLTGVTALAATGKLQGFFKDIVDWNGAVTGLSYEQATDEIELSIVEVSDILTVEITWLNPESAPYNEIETCGIKNYKITDMTGKVMVEGKATEVAEVVNGKVRVNISLDNIAEGEYKLIVSELEGNAKAEQPLTINGTWECEFIR